MKFFFYFFLYFVHTYTRFIKTEILFTFLKTEQKDLAISLYREGIQELERGINIDVWSGTGEKWIKAQRLHDKMQTNLAMAKDRLNFLGEYKTIYSLISNSMLDKAIRSYSC